MEIHSVTYCNNQNRTALYIMPFSCLLSLGKQPRCTQEPVYNQPLYFQLDVVLLDYKTIKIICSNKFSKTCRTILAIQIIILPSALNI